MGTRLKLVLLSFLAVTASAQVRERVTVEVIEVTVYVTTTSAAVTVLTRDNFQLFIDGKRQPIEYFDAVDFGVIGAPVERKRPDPRQRRLYLLVFDLLFSTPNSIARAQVAADKLIAHAGEADQFSVATYTHNNGVDLLVPFTRDRVAVRRAILLEHRISFRHVL